MNDMKNSEMINRKNIYNRISNELSLLDDKQIAKLLESSTSIGESIGGSTALLKLSGTNIFVKKIRLTDIERLPENEMSTANLFHLPLYYQYGVGSTGFGAWRELAAHLLANQWVLQDQCQNFPCLYHWRVLPSPVATPDQEQFKRLEQDVAYWNHSQAIRERLESNLYASAHIVLFLEYFPNNLYQWLQNQIAQGDAAANNACEMVDNQLTQTILFMQSQNFIHFDAHFYNIVTDGHHLYFGDFGLANSSTFELSEEEKAFLYHHRDYDSYSAMTSFLHCLVTYYIKDNNANWIESLVELIDDKHQTLPVAISTIIKRYVHAAALMDKFYQDLQKDKTTIYPAKELGNSY